MKNKIVTERLLLRPFQPSDYQAVYEFGSNAELHRYTGDEMIESKEEAKTLIQNVWLNDYEKYGYGRWATIYLPDNKLIGFTGLKYLPEFQVTDIGYRYLPNYWGKGIATEAAKAMIQYGFEQLNLERIIGIVIPDNIASSNVLKKIGFTFYQEADYDAENKSCHWYEINKAKYAQSK